MDETKVVYDRAAKKSNLSFSLKKVDESMDNGIINKFQLEKLEQKIPSSVALHLLEKNGTIVYLSSG